MIKRFIILALVVLVSLSASAAVNCGDITAQISVKAEEVNVQFYSGSPDRTRINFYYPGEGFELLVKNACLRHAASGLTDTETYHFEIPPQLPIVAKSDLCTWTITKLTEGYNVIDVKGVAKKK